LLGTFDVRQAGTSIAISSRPAQSLLAYLVLTAGTPHRREKLAGLLWPDSLEETARDNLRHALWRVRKALRSASVSCNLKANDLTISFDILCEYWFDVAALEKLKGTESADELISVLSGYQGEILPGFYDEWVVLEREHVNSIFEHNMARLMSLLQDENRWLDILDWGERWIKLGQKPEPAYRALMSAHAAKGDMAKVVATYDRCVKSLKELEVEPSELTRALYERLKAGAELIETGSIHLNYDKRIESPKTNLPTPLTSFVGRENEVREVLNSLDSHRLVTLTGPGGVGKTRLAIQTSNQMLNDFKNGVWWVELAPLTDEALIPQVVAQALGVRESPTQPLTESLITYLQEKKLLLVLDNCEHLIDACAQLAHDLLIQCANLRILATSREAMDIMGEFEYSVQPLTLPISERLSLVDLLIEYEGIRLFVERANSKSGFKLTDQNAPAVFHICRQLDGIPLAIELAAARTKTLTIDQIAERLNDRLNLLTQGNRTALPRHQTLRALIDWSYDLLSEEEQALFRRLAVFVGGWTLEGARAVFSDALVDENRISKVISLLVDKSLVIVQKQGGEVHYQMLETIRQYGEEKLRMKGEIIETRNRHLEFFFQLAEQARPELVSSKQSAWLSIMDADYGNFRSALEWAMETNPARALQLAAALGQYWEIRGFINEGRFAIEKALQQANNAPREARAIGFQWEGRLAARQGDYVRAKAPLEKSLELWRELGDKRGLANSLRFLGNVDSVQGEYALAQISYEESLVLLREIGDKRGIASVMSNLGTAALGKGDHLSARHYGEESVAIFRELEDKFSLVMALNNLGVVAEEQGDNFAARRFYEESIAISRDLREKSFVVYPLNGLAHVYYLQGDLSNAQHYYRESLVISQEIGEKRAIVYCLEGFAKVTARQGNAKNAANLFGAANALRQAIGVPLDPSELAEIDQDVSATRELLNDQTFDSAWEEGLAMSMEQAIEFALRESQQRHKMQK